MTGTVVGVTRDWTDWEAVHTLLTHAFAGMEGRIDPPSSLLRMSARDLAAQSELLTAVAASRLVGCLIIEDRGDMLYLGKLAVSLDARRRGIARLLVDHAESIARERKVPALLLQTRIELVENHATFRAMGFVEVGRTAHPGYNSPTSITFRKLI